MNFTVTGFAPAGANGPSWVLTGSNNGFLGTQPNHKPIAMTGTAIWEVREDGKLTRNTVEQASFEVYHSLIEK